MEFCQVWGLAVFISCCCIHCYTDFKEQLLYDEISLLMLVIGLGLRGITGELEAAMLGAALAGGAFFLLFVFSKGGLGFGDVKLAVVLGVWLGWEKALLGLMLALWMGSIVGITLLSCSLRTRKDAIAFGPYMCAGAITMIFYGEGILNWYYSLF